MTTNSVRGVLTHDWGLAQGWSFFRPHLRSGVQGASGGAQRGYSEKAMLGLGACTGLGSSNSGDRSAPSTSGGNGSPASEATVGSASPRAESVSRGRQGAIVALTEVQRFDEEVGDEATNARGVTDDDRHSSAQLYAATFI